MHLHFLKQNKTKRFVTLLPTIKLISTRNVPGGLNLPKVHSRYMSFFS